ncbi:hypothetical protein BDV95DRAFT_144631 [Massariosphaeria phaeospora]|uniref:LysM domain-containing protein n=1 Tax=Massariosphaeria phaeospora TaxID=100035 RepID=A0A7C8IE67_9PLEO|nr:hypothetical protein BDV95DRAFT_144631 [Massariosphaeria phaeospora]
MIALSSLIAASSLFGLSISAPLPRSNTAAARSLVDRAVSYTVFGGDGSTQSGWPAESDWLSFEDAWKANEPLLAISCGQFGVPNNDDAENQALFDAIKDAGTATNMNPAFILAIVMQETKGCVRSPTTSLSHSNPGLMQSFQGTGSCNMDKNALIPCPKETINLMIQEGVGIKTAFGLKQTLESAGTTGASKYYIAARKYNSGSLDASGNLGLGGATACYASDVANRLLGWIDMTVTARKCTEGVIGKLSASEVFTSASKSQSKSDEKAPAPPVNTPTPTPSPAPVSAPKDIKAAKATTPTKGEPEAVAPPSQTPETTADAAPEYPLAAPGCKNWHTVAEGDTCDSLKHAVDFDTLKSLNKDLNDKCTNLWRGYKYCIAA